MTVIGRNCVESACPGTVLIHKQQQLVGVLRGHRHNVNSGDYIRVRTIDCSGLGGWYPVHDWQLREYQIVQHTDGTVALVSDKNNCMPKVKEHYGWLDRAEAFAANAMGNNWYWSPDQRYKVVMDKPVRKSLRAGREWHMFGIGAEDNGDLVVFEYEVRVQDES